MTETSFDDNDERNLNSFTCTVYTVTFDLELIMVAPLYGPYRKAKGSDGKARKRWRWTDFLFCADGTWWGGIFPPWRLADNRLEQKKKTLLNPILPCEILLKGREFGIPFFVHQSKRKLILGCFRTVSEGRMYALQQHALHASTLNKSAIYVSVCLLIANY